MTTTGNAERGSVRLQLRGLGGWEIYDGDTHIGWVTRHKDGWGAYVVRSWDGQGQQVGWHMSTRREAVAEVEINREV